MRHISLILFILTFLSCSQHKISYNPFEPNYNIDLKTVLDSGFNLSFAESLFCYEKNFSDYKMYFYYDSKENKIVGEGYFFEIGSISTRSDSIQDKILNLDIDHDFDISKYKIEKLLDKFNSSIISGIFCWRGGQEVRDFRTSERFSPKEIVRISPAEFLRHG